MQIQSNIYYLPYVFHKSNPYYEWGDEFYSPPVHTGKLHVHNCLEIGYCYQGSGIFLAEQEIRSFSARDVSIVLPGKAHIATSNPSDISYWHFVMIDVGLFYRLFLKELPVEDFLQKNQDFPYILHPEDYPELCMNIYMIVEQFHNKATEYNNIVRGLITALIFQIKSLGVLNNIDLRNASYDAIAPALNMISASYQSPISVALLAEACNMSESTFRRAFKASVGKAPMDFVYETRIEAASSLLREGKYSIGEIAQMTGYDSISSFNRHFRKYKQMSPREWRQI